MKHEKKMISTKVAKKLKTTSSGYTNVNTRQINEGRITWFKKQEANSIENKYIASSWKDKL